MGAFAAADAAGQVQGVAELHARQRLEVANGRAHAVLLLALVLQRLQDALQVGGLEFAVMLLEQAVEGDLAAFQREQRLERRHQPGHARHRRRPCL